ncbi:MAG: hypothetical protein AAGF93_20855, partial [Cyanobacteria bacterium P01_H01_bin.105]
MCRPRWMQWVPLDQADRHLACLRAGLLLACFGQLLESRKRDSAGHSDCVIRILAPRSQRPAQERLV